MLLGQEFVVSPGEAVNSVIWLSGLLVCPPSTFTMAVIVELCVAILWV